MHPYNCSVPAPPAAEIEYSMVQSPTPAAADLTQQATNLLRASSSLRILILSAGFGGGHQSTAEALASWWEQAGCGAQVKVIDYYGHFVSPVISQAATIGYTQSVRLFPLGYRLFYDLTAHLKPDSSAQQWLNQLGRDEFAEWLENEPADIIVAVHPTPCGALSDLRRLGRLKKPVVSVITDYVVHSQWIHPNTDLYIVGSDAVRDGLVKRGVPESKIRVTGIPVKANTALLQQREALREKWGLKPGLPTVLVMTGAQGMMRRPWRLFHAVASQPVQGFFLCGKDRALAARLKMWSDQYEDFRIMRFVRIVPELMCVSDLLISKAGGLTTTEALAMELPMLLFHPIPGQEIANRDFLSSVGAAVTANTTSDVSRVLGQLCREPERLDQMREAIRRVRRPYAAQHAAIEMLQLWHEESRWNR